MSRSFDERRGAHARPGSPAAPDRRPVDDDTLLELLELARARGSEPAAPHGASSWCATPTSATSSHGPTGRAGRSTSASCAPGRARTRCSRRDNGSPTTSRTCPCIVVACVEGRRPIFPAVGASSFYAARLPRRAEPAARRGRAGSRARPRTMLPLWSMWQARRTLGPATFRHPGRGGRPRLAAGTGRTRPHRRRSATSSISTAGATSRFALGPARARPDTA